MNEHINKLFESVEWTPVARVEINTPDGTLYATHQGTIHVYDFTFKVYQLNDGTRVVDADDVEKFIAKGSRPWK